MKYIIALLIVLGTAIVSTLVKWLDGKIIQKITGKSSEKLRNDKKCFIPIALLTLSLGTLNKPKTCRMVDLIAHAMSTFVSKFS